MRTFLASTALLTALVFSASVAHAAATLEKASPDFNATVKSASEIELKFNEEISATSTVQLMRDTGMPLASKTEASGHSMIAKPTDPLTPGGYRVMWRAVTKKDQQSLQGSYAFHISDAAAPASKEPEKKTTTTTTTTTKAVEPAAKAETIVPAAKTEAPTEPAAAVTTHSTTSTTTTTTAPAEKPADTAPKKKFLGIF